MNNYQLCRTNPKISGQIKWDLILSSSDSELYISDFSLSPISRHVYQSKSIDNILNSHHIPRYTMGQRFNKKTIVTKNGVVVECFDSTMDAAEWLIASGYSKAKKKSAVRSNINQAVSEDKEYLGFKFYYESKR